MAHSLEQQAAEHDNDYTPLEEAYRLATGVELVTDPFGSVRRAGPPLTFSASVIIPAWNAHDTIERCLIAIEQSSFNLRYPGRLEAVVVDDGSTDDTWSILERLDLGVRVLAVHQEHHSRAHTQNTGLAVAGGDVAICCDADMVLAPFAIEEMVARHQVLDNVLLMGFRGDANRADPRIQPAALPRSLPGLLPPYGRDMRLNYGGAGWPESICRDSDHLKRLSQLRDMITADGARWNLSGLVWGALFSMRRADFVTMGGYDERFFGWGCEDTLVGIRGLALQRYVLPVYSAAGLHVTHPDRSPRKGHEHAANRRVLYELMRAPFEPAGADPLAAGRQRVRRQIERAPNPGRAPAGPDTGDLWRAFEAELACPGRRGRYLMSMGRYVEAAAAFAQVDSPAEAAAWALCDRARALRLLGAADEALPLLLEAGRRLPVSPLPALELALSLAAVERFAEAGRQLERAARMSPYHPLVLYLRRGLEAHCARGADFARLGHHRLAVRDFDAALILDPRHAAARAGRAEALAALGLSAPAAALPAGGTLATNGHDAADPHAGLPPPEGRPSTLKAVLERARQWRASDPQVAARLVQVSRVAQRAHPLPWASAIVAETQAIPGWLAPAEAELLVALALRATSLAASDERPCLVEIGSYCGRATLTMALALHGLNGAAPGPDADGTGDGPKPDGASHRPSGRIIAIDEPALGPGPGGEPARDALRGGLAMRGLEGYVICAPEDAPLPTAGQLHLLLVNGRRDYAGVQADVARYAGLLAPGGLLAFHDYDDGHPDVQRSVHELLTGREYDFVAQSGALIALVRRTPARAEDATIGRTDLAVLGRTLP